MELAKALLPLGGIILTFLLTWLLGNRISATWAHHQKQRETDLALAQEFYRLYGEFFATWKRWEFARKHASEDKMEDLRFRAFERACDAEGMVERLFVKLATERVLDEAARNALGRFRQGFQFLRESIRSDRSLEWRRSEEPKYRAFKELATEVAGIISRVGRTLPSSPEAKSSILHITSNRFEGHWWEPEPPPANLR